MKSMLLVIFCMVWLTAAEAFAVEVAWMYVQHREYGGGKTTDRLGFGLVDDQYHYLADAAPVKGVTLLDPNRNVVSLSPLKFRSVYRIYGTYDATNSQWHYNPDWGFDSWFSSDISGSLIPGIYRLAIPTAGGKTIDSAFEFKRQIALPIVGSLSIQLKKDRHGNLIWTWNVPEELGFLSLKSKIRARAVIDIYRNRQNTGYFSIILPAHMGYVFIPREVVDMLDQKGDRFEFIISLETKDNNNRTYSMPSVVEGSLSTAAK